MSEINLPPFYPGQQVVAVDAMKGSVFKNGIQYEVTKCDCRFGNPHHPVGKVTKYWYVGIVGHADGHPYWRPTIFAPLEQKEFPALTFSEIVEAEKLEVLIAN